MSSHCEMGERGKGPASAKSRNGVVPRPAVQRVLDRVSIDSRTGCFIWQGRVDRAGYGQVTVGLGAEKRKSRTHKVVYEAVHGPVPEGLVIDHLCRNPSCCNPEHLEAVPHRANVLRGVSPPAKAAVQTHCVHGHEYTPENIYQDAKGHRHCRECRRRVSAKRVGSRKRRRLRARKAAEATQ